MIFGKKDPLVEELDELYVLMKSNLENNYKDNALNALKELELKCEEYKDRIKDKDYKRISMLVSTYKDRLKDYHH